MSYSVVETASALPALVIFVPTATAVLIFIFGRMVSWLRETLAVIGAVGAMALSLAIGYETFRGKILTSFEKQLYADSLSALLVILVSLISLTAIVYSLKYMWHQVKEGGLPHTTTSGRLTTFYGWLMLFISTMIWACLSNNIIMLYVAVEASTIASGLLVAFYWDKRALEAGYKYLMLLTVGITFSLFGCVLLYATGSNLPGVGGSKGLLISELRLHASSFPITTVVLASAFLIIGFGTKAGVAPFHPWLPDAHAEAPTPISALLSGVMIKVAMYALVRTVTIFYPSFSPVAMFALGLGVFTLVIGDLMALAQDDLKRMLAYSSVSQIGYILMGFGIGTQLGMYAGLFHMVNHAIAKALLFLAAGAVIYSTGVRSVSQLGGLAKKMPITSFCFFIGALAVSGIPPLNGFHSKLALFIAGANAGNWLAIGFGIAASLVTLVVLLKAAKNIFWGEESMAVAQPSVREAPLTVVVSMLFLAILCLAIGLYPRGLYPPIKAAASYVQTINLPNRKTEKI
ncbi:MAG: proton-conducting transporter membrane subunit, partial [Armatimonadota bacterium]|nr:proton-conducting transporter membrane subunit [Armatimonadota bacterium]